MRALLMGGQACILYGAAEFSRDVDVAVLASEANLQRLRAALAELRAEPVFVPPLGQEVLLRGHACHFRSRVAEVQGIRIDIMSVMHGCDPFDELWRRRRRLSLAGLGTIHVLSLPDLVRAKKTQRDKDWPMIRRLVEVDYHCRRSRPARAQILFWLQECRTSELLLELSRRYPILAREVAASRPAVRAACAGDVSEVERVLHAEEEALRAADRAYWQPLRAELFRWRRALRASAD
ncbi:MAG TPA: hypothetical protein VGY58_12255 [Gemmataceae bacterium]|nr:hypothetical protein [Gemmataceae bacterium]